MDFEIYHLVPASTATIVDLDVRPLADGVDFDSGAACLVIDGVRISLPHLGSLVATLPPADQAEWRLQRFYRDGDAVRVDSLPIHAPLAEILRGAGLPRTGEEQP